VCVCTNQVIVAEGCLIPRRKVERIQEQRKKRIQEQWKQYILLSTDLNHPVLEQKITIG